MNETRRALQHLVDKLHEIHRDPAYMAMWFDAANYYGRPYTGPNYAAELAAAVDALAVPEVDETELDALRLVYEAARRMLRFDGVDRARRNLAVDDLVTGVECVKQIDAGYDALSLPSLELTDDQIIAVRDAHLPSQGEPFDCLAFARAVLEIR